MFTTLFKKSLLLISLLCLELNYFTQEPFFNFNNNVKKVQLGKDVFILEDQTNALSVNEVLNSTDFKKSNESIINLPTSKSDYWIKFSINNNSDIKELLLELACPTIDEVFLYSINNSTNFNLSKQAEHDPIKNREYNHQHYIFKLSTPPKNKATFLLKIRVNHAVSIPLNIGTEKEILQSLGNQDYLFGMYSGIMIIMALYNLFIFFTVKDKSYLIYVFYVLAMLLTQGTLHGYTHRFIWTESEWFTYHAIFLVTPFSGIFGIAFFQRFLITKINIPSLHKLSYVIIGLYVFILLITLLGQYTLAFNLLDLTALALSLYMLVGAIIISNKGYRPAKFFLFAWCLFLIGIILFVLKNSGIIEANSITDNILPIGSALETILLSLALADKINIFRKEKEIAQKKTVDAIREKEKLIVQQNVFLEQKVKERTKELDKTLQNLTSTQNKLVESEKMASLGQLTAGIAHEINNPINFVKSNVRPLRRDIEHIFELLLKYEEIKSGNEISTHLKNISSFKKEIDADILEEEINSLLTGIEEGASRTAKIVDSLKAFSRNSNESKYDFDLTKSIESCLTILNYRLKKQNIIVEKNLTEELVLYANADRMNQVFMNILDNAIDAILEKGLAAENRIIITGKTHYDGIEISIQDNGIGMHEELKSKIFDPFYTSKEIGKGMGLGLSITYGIVKSHNGTISVESKKDKGTIFTLSFKNNNH